MTMTSKDTRQRLLDLWEKCPECKPFRLGLQQSVWVLNISGAISEDTAFALANEAMIRRLAVEGFAPQLSHDVVFRLTIGREDFDPEWMEFPGTADTLTDALISAMEAVMEKKDG